MTEMTTDPAVKAMADDDGLSITELVEFDPTRLDGVKTGATGIPFLIMKAAAEPEPEPEPAADEPAAPELAKGERPPWHAAAAALARMGAKVEHVPPSVLFKAVAADGSVDEGPDIDGGKQALMLVGKLIEYEAQELAAGHFDETMDIALLLEAMSALKCWLSMERSNVMATADDEAMSCGGCGCCPACYGAVMCSAAEKALADAQEAARAKAAGEAGKSSAAVVADGSTEVQTDHDGQLEQLVAAEVAKALSAREESDTALRDELAKAQADIAKFSAMPVPGGPVMSITRPSTGGASGETHTAKAAYLREQADAVGGQNRELADSYRQLARQEDEKATRAAAAPAAG